MALRPARSDDCESLWRWRNDPATRRASFDQGEIDRSAHARWFAETLARADRRLYLVTVGDRDAGMVRLDLVRREATVSINLAPEWRGRGVGRAALVAVRDVAFASLGLECLVALVKADNPASRRVFEQAGFVVAREGDPARLTCEREGGRS